MELLRDRRAEFDAAGVQPIGISRDSPWTHIAWTQALDLNFGLLSDWNGEAIHAFGIVQEFRGLKDVAQRSAFLLGADGIVRGAWHYGTSDVPDVDELLAACRGLQSSDRGTS
jgi:peroxiredoxin